MQHPFVTGEQIQQGLRGVVANDFNNGNGEKQGHACKDQDDDMCEVYDKDEESPVVGSVSFLIIRVSMKKLTLLE